MRYYCFNGRFYDCLEITIDNEIILQTYNFFNPADESSLNLIFDKINRKKRKGNLVIRGFLDDKAENTFKLKYVGRYFEDIFHEYTDKKAFFDYFKRIEYKNL